MCSPKLSLKSNPKYVNKVVAPTLEPVKSIGGFRTVPDYSFDTMPDDYAALVLIGGFGWATPVAERVVPYNPQNETCDALRTKRAKIKTKRFSISKRSVLLRRFTGYHFFKKISTRLRRDLTASRLSI